MSLSKGVGPRHKFPIFPRIGMKPSRSLRLAFSHGLLGSALLAGSAFAGTSSDFNLLRIKADRGNAIAQYNLGLAYANRSEPSYDLVQAYAWLSLAATNGTTGKALANVTSLLSPEQLAEGKLRLAAISSSPVSPISTAASPIMASDQAVSPPPASVPPSEHDPERKKLSAELTAAWNEAELLKAGLTAQLADANKRVAIAEAALASKDKEIAYLQNRLAESTATAAAPVGVSAELASLRAERDQLQATATARAIETESLRAASEKAAKEPATLRGQLANASAELADSRRAQNLAESEAASLKTAADRARAERLAFATQLEAATAELEKTKSATQRPAELISAADLATLKNEHETANKQIAALGHQRTLAENAAAEKDGQIHTLKLRLNQLEAAADTQLSDTGLAVLKADRDRLAETVKTLETQRDTLTAQLASVAAASSNATESTPDPGYATRLAELQKSKDETDTKLEAALRAFTLQQGEIERLQKSLASIEDERAATASKLATTTAELNTLRPQAATATTAATEADILRAQLDAAKQSLAEKSSALASANASLADARKTIDTAAAELITTRDQLRQTQAQSAASAIEAQQLKTRLALVGNLPAGANPSRPGALPSISIDLPATPAAPIAPVPAKAETSAGPRFHTVGAGDSLSRISKQYYGTATRWNDILQANKEAIRNPDALTLGTKLRIP